ncbi:hypothetical protein PCANC_06863 [Puccinia coronata f. sp. avenae]|uniref:SP-RING-type domain-containing protein n=1 Tax=Puccinia coronata f. sp. avenae TaxID=200324 RepID=A0A2N5VVG3_9BASI|nr:hypothetical protein PCANC_06863 [Puccinia coronata f. sp. avenae]
MTTIYQDFSKLRSFLPSLRVEELKSIIRLINSYFHVSARLTGKKDELITRIEGYLQDSISQHKFDNYDHIRADIYRYCRPPYTHTYTRPVLPYPTPHSSTTTLSSSSAAAAAAATTSSSSSSSSLRANVSASDLCQAPLANPHHPHHHTHHPHHQQHNHHHNHSHQTKADPVFGSTSTPSSMMRSSGYPIKQPTNNPNLNSHPNNPYSSSSFSHKSSILTPFSSSNSAPFNPRALPITFETSPFFRIDSAASIVAICHKAAQNDRKSVPLSLILSSEQRFKLSPGNVNASGSQYQLRMFATSEQFYQHPSYLTNPAHAPVLPPALMEFPTTIDIKLNACSIEANLKGIKKQPGTAPPPNLAQVPGKNGVGNALDLREGKPNQIEIAYSNCDKRFYFVIYLVEYFGVYGLMKNLKANRKRGHDQVIKEILAGSGDEDVMTSASVITLTDPVVFGRIKVPIRSMRCKHLQCFDAEMFYTMMEQTPTWLCPVCNAKLKNDEIAVDEYFESILKAAPGTIDSVIVEADGKWHDERYQIGTSAKKASSRSVMSVESGGSTGQSDARKRSREPDPNQHHHLANKKPSKKRKVTVLDLESDDPVIDDDDDDNDDDDDDDNDDDDEDEDDSEDEDDRSLQVRSLKRHSKPFGNSADCVIDLTLDDD